MSSKVVYYDAVPSSAKPESPESDDVEEMMIAKRGGCCFWSPCFGSDPATSPDGSWERVRNDGPWWARGWRKIREWSELVAGPKWKTFIRRFNKSGGGNKRGGAKFQYDPMSYSRNFDEGPGQNGDFDEGYLYRDFSSRYASVPASAKSSMDLGKDAPPFT